MNPGKKDKIKKFFFRKRVIIPVALIVVIGAFVFLFHRNNNSVSVITPTVGDLTLSIQATGQVTSNTDLSLSFNKSGVIKSIRTEVGDTVSAGQILASLSQSSELAGLTQARGALAAAEARLKRTMEGATGEEVTLAQVNLDQAKLTQAILVKNAYHTLLNSIPEAVPEGGLSDYTAPTISGSYTGETEGTIKINIYATGSSSSFSVSGLTTGSGVVTTTTTQPLGNSGLYIKFPSTISNIVSNWVVTIPNKKASNYLTNYNAYQSALQESQSTIDKLSAELALKKAQARPSDVELGQADVLSAEGGLQAAQALYEDTIIRAPASGTVTKVAIKYGELADIKKPSIIIQDITHLYIESDINESNIAQVKVGQSIDLTFDALGKNKKFTGQVVHVDPSSVTTEGIVNYKIKVSINEKDVQIRPGMNAEIVITVDTKPNVIAVPKAAVTTVEGKSYVNLITDEKSKKYIKHEVTTSGFVGDGNLMEITHGLSASQKIALNASKK